MKVPKVGHALFAKASAIGRCITPKEKKNNCRKEDRNNDSKQLRIVVSGLSENVRKAMHVPLVMTPKRREHQLRKIVSFGCKETVPITLADTNMILRKEMQRHKRGEKGNAKVTEQKHVTGGYVESASLEISASMSMIPN